jgi:renalase
MTYFDNIIIGAGISGLIVGQRLHDENKNYIILEKSRGLGGRIATRRIEELGFDHGTPYLKHNVSVFELLESAKLRDIKIDDKGIYLDGGMTKISKALGQNLNIEKNIRVEKIGRYLDKWLLETADGGKYSAKTVVLTAPIPQAIELLNASLDDYAFKQTLQDITYAKAVLALIVTEKTVALKSELAPNIHSILSMKERQLHQSGYIIRGSVDFSDEQFERSDEEILMSLKDLFMQSVETPPSIRHIELKKWRYVTPHRALPYNYIQVRDDLYLIGDGFFYPDIRGSISSAKSLVTKLL